jgi:uncharacterized membrane protein
MQPDSLVQTPGLVADRAASLAATRAAVRLGTVDMLRGLVILLMILDHVRMYFTDVRFDPLDLTQTSPELFLTRWITHYCAPIFVFLAGVSAWLVGQRCTKAELSRFLATRGLWLVVLELSVINWAWTFSLDYEIGLFLQVIWAIGVSMILLALLVRLPVRSVGVIAIALIAGHNLFDGVDPAALGGFETLWRLLHVKSQAGFGYILYPIVPWVGVMALGYALGGIFQLEPQRRRRTLAVLGIGMIAAFVAIRLLNGYGNPQQWSVQASALYTVFSFIDVQKYPPSLLYVLVTLGPGLLLLAAFDSVRGHGARIMELFGRVPMFAYVLHIVLVHLAAGLVGLATGYGTDILGAFAIQYPVGWGFGLGVVYLVWILVIAALYPLVKWFADVKRRRRDWWLSYL